MLIPKKMSAKKILQYGALMSVTLGATGYLILKNFVAPGLFNKVTPDAGTVFVETPVAEDPVETARDDADRKSLFEDEKFIKLRDYMNSNIDIESISDNVGKKNPFEAPKKIIKEQPAEESGGSSEIPTSTPEQQFISL